MEKMNAYKMSIAEAEELLQNATDNSSLKLVHKVGDMDFPSFFYAVSDSQNLDGAEIDERFAQILHVDYAEHYATDDGGLVIIAKGDEKNA